MQAVRVAKGDVIQVQGGAIKGEDLLGKQYGSKVILLYHRITCCCIISRFTQAMVNNGC